ncbi:MAG: diacylglycerol kinase family protein [Pseudopedobacter sp.]|nr:diacylglycerol kinase family protein [Deinococcales bacterium]
MPDPNHRRNSFVYALEGLYHVYRTQSNFRLELFLGILALGVSLWLRTNLTPILICTLLVLALEMLNTALEAACDAVTLEQNLSVKIAKDAAAGAVLLAAYFSVLVAIVEILPTLAARLLR